MKVLLTGTTGAQLASIRLLATNASWSLLSHLLSRGSLMLSAILLARALDTSGFAAYSYFQLTVSMLAAYAAMGMSVTASRFFAEVGYENADGPPPLGTLWCLSLLLAVFAAVVVLLLPSGWLNAGLSVPRWMIALGVFVLAIGVVPGGATLGLEQYRQVSLISAISGITMLLGAWLAISQNSAEIGMAALLLAFLIQAIGESVLTIRSLRARRLVDGLRFRWSEIKRVFGFAGPMLVVSLLSASGAWLLGRVILYGPGGEQAFALYAIGLQWFALALLLPGMLTRVILPRLVRGRARDADYNENKLMIRYGAMMAMFIAIVVTGFGVAFGPWLISIYGDNYDAGRWFIGAFMAAAILSAPANVIGNAIVVNDGQMRWLTLTSVWLVVLLLAGLAVNETGAWSGAIAQAIGALVLTILAIIVARSRQLI